jgi:hypothetical protein
MHQRNRHRLADHRLRWEEDGRHPEKTLTVRTSGTDTATTLSCGVRRIDNDSTDRQLDGSAGIRRSEDLETLELAFGI